MKGRTEEAEKILLQNNGHVAGYSAKEAIVRGLSSHNVYVPLIQSDVGPNRA
jgi:hypothetical protein